MSRYESSHDHVPLAMQTVRVIADGADGYRLLSADDAVIGWVRGRAIGVNGFDHEGDAVSAAIRAYAVLAPWLERQQLHPLSALGDEPARCVHDGAHRWLLTQLVGVAPQSCWRERVSRTECRADPASSRRGPGSARRSAAVLQAPRR